MSTAKKIEHTLEVWHDILARNAMEELDPILAENVVFRSPVVHAPYLGRGPIKVILKNVNLVFKDFTYHRTLVTADGMSVVLEFTALVDDRQVQGIDFLRFDDEGKIKDFEVMMRPLSGLNALAKNMGERLAPFKDQLGRS